MKVSENKESEDGNVCGEGTPDGFSLAPPHMAHKNRRRFLNSKRRKAGKGNTMKKQNRMWMLLVLLTVLLCSTVPVLAAKKVSSVQLNKKKLTLYAGESTQLKVTVKPTGASKKVTWKSSKPTVATVSSKGKIKAKKAGKTVITVTSKQNKKVSAKCTVTVKKLVKLTKITLSETELKMSAGDKKTLTAVLTPKKPTYKDIVWASSDEKVAAVSAAGEVTAAAAGTAVITCTSVKYPKISASCTVTVQPELTDRDELDDAETILALTVEPVYLRRQRKNVTVDRDSAGRKIWEIELTENHTVKYVHAYQPGGYNIIASTFCKFTASPYLTLSSAAGDPQGIWDALQNGTYDFAKNPSGVLMSWNSLNPDMSKDVMEKILNQKLSEEVYEELKGKVSGRSATTESTVILYGRDGDGTLTAKYAGYVRFVDNIAETELFYNVIGVNPANDEDYGKHIFDNVRFR